MARISNRRFRCRFRLLPLCRYLAFLSLWAFPLVAAGQGQVGVQEVNDAIGNGYLLEIRNKSEDIKMNTYNLLTEQQSANANIIGGLTNVVNSVNQQQQNITSIKTSTGQIATYSQIMQGDIQSLKIDLGSLVAKDYGSTTAGYPDVNVFQSQRELLWDMNARDDTYLPELQTIREYIQSMDGQMQQDAGLLQEIADNTSATSDSTFDTFQQLITNTIATNNQLQWIRSGTTHLGGIKNNTNSIKQTNESILAAVEELRQANDYNFEIVHDYQAQNVDELISANEELDLQTYELERHTELLEDLLEAATDDEGEIDVADEQEFEVKNFGEFSGIDGWGIQAQTTTPWQENISFTMPDGQEVTYQLDMSFDNAAGWNSAGFGGVQSAFSTFRDGLRNFITASIGLSLIMLAWKQARGGE